MMTQARSTGWNKDHTSRLECKCNRSAIFAQTRRIAQAECALTEGAWLSSPTSQPPSQWRFLCCILLLLPQANQRKRMNKEKLPTPRLRKRKPTKCMKILCANSRIFFPSKLSRTSSHRSHARVANTFGAYSNKVNHIRHEFPTLHNMSFAQRRNQTVSSVL